MIGTRRIPRPAWLSFSITGVLALALASASLFAQAKKPNILVIWPRVTKPGTINNDIFSHEDMLPTLMAATGDAEVKEKLQEYVGKFIARFNEYPPSQRAGRQLLARSSAGEASSGRRQRQVIARP